MNSSFNLSAYFARISYDGPRVPTLETLRAISSYTRSSTQRANAMMKG